LKKTKKKSEERNLQNGRAVGQTPKIGLVDIPPICGVQRQRAVGGVVELVAQDDVTRTASCFKLRLAVASLFWSAFRQNHRRDKLLLCIELFL
jgi:hypothetical protein